MPTPIENAKSLAEDLRAVFKKQKASTYMTHAEERDGSVTVTLRIVPGDKLKFDAPTLKTEVTKP